MQKSRITTKKKSMGLKKFQNQIQVVIFRRKASARLPVMASIRPQSVWYFGIFAFFFGGGVGGSGGIIRT